MNPQLQAVKKARSRIEGLGRLSDDLFRVGPLRLGLDGLLAWAPGVGEAYSLGVGLGLALLGAQARVPAWTLVQTGLLIGARSLLGAPASALLGPLYPLSAGAVDLFRAHKWSADLLLAAMDRRLYLSAAAGSPVAQEAEALAAREGLVIVRLNPALGPPEFSVGGR